MNGENKSSSNRMLTSILIILAVLSAGGGAAFLFIKLKKKPQSRPPKTEGTLVEVVEAAKANRPVVVETLGTVVPARELELRSEVGGKIVEQNKLLVPGAIFPEGGELLCRVDPRDYQDVLEQRKAQREQARLALKVEEGRGAVARREWEMLKQEMTADGASEELALRKPHMAQARAALKSAESAVARAELDIERTRVTVPFPAVVQEEFVEFRQLLSPQTRIARLAGTEKFWVRCSVPADRLRFIKLPGLDGKGGAGADVVQECPGRKDEIRRGKVVRLLPELDPAGRMARVLVEVEDPLSLKPTDDGKEKLPPLLLGSYVQVRIDGPELEDVVPLPRKAVHEGNRVWVMNAKGLLEFREVDIAWSLRQEVLVGEGIAPGDRVVLTPIAGAYPGMKLRLPGDEKDKSGNKPSERAGSKGNKK